MDIELADFEDLAQEAHEEKKKHGTKEKNTKSITKGRIEKTKSKKAQSHSPAQMSVITAAAFERKENRNASEGNPPHNVKSYNATVGEVERYSPL